MKLLLCIAVHLYHGPIEPETKVTVVSEACNIVATEKARKVLQACAKQGTTKCEVLVSKDRVTIEHKIEVKP